MIRHLKTRLRPQIYYTKGTSQKLIWSCTSLNTASSLSYTTTFSVSSCH